MYKRYGSYASDGKTTELISLNWYLIKCPYVYNIHYYYHFISYKFCISHKRLSDWFKYVSHHLYMRTHHKKDG